MLAIRTPAAVCRREVEGCTVQRGLAFLDYGMNICEGQKVPQSPKPRKIQSNEK